MDSATIKMQRLRLWMEEQGATFPAMQILTKDNGERETVAGAALKAGQLVAHIPRSLLLSVEIAQASRIGRLLASHSPDAPYKTYLAACLLDTARNGGFWAPYVRVLPHNFPEHPVFFSESELQYLKGSYTLRLIRQDKDWLERECARLRACLPGEKAFSRDECAWALGNVLTRRFTFRSSGQRVRAMVPLGDMPNHAIKANVRWRSDSARGLILTAMRDLEAGSPLTITYQRQSGNGRLFFTYGFCLESNPYNQAEIKLSSLAPEHPQFKAARRLGSLRDGMRIFKVSVDDEHTSTKELFAYLRLSVRPESSAVNSGADGNGIALDAPLVPQHEHAVCAALASACRRGLQEFDTTIEEDEDLLKDDALPLKLRFAIRVRHGEKAVLKHFLDLAKTPVAAP